MIYVWLLVDNSNTPKNVLHPVNSSPEVLKSPRRTSLHRAQRGRHILHFLAVEGVVASEDRF